MRFVAVSLGALVLGATLLAAIAARAPAQNVEVGLAPTTDRSQAGQLDKVTAGANIRASKLIGLPIMNREGKHIAMVNDIVIDASQGEARYMAVSYGGFLGLGNKLFAVPWEAFECRHDIDNDKYRLVLNVSEEKIRTAEGFDQDNWPDFGDPDFTNGVDLHYDVERDAHDEYNNDEVDSVRPDGGDDR